MLEIRRGFRGCVFLVPAMVVSDFLLALISGFLCYLRSGPRCVNQCDLRAIPFRKGTKALETTRCHSLNRNENKSASFMRNRSRIGLPVSTLTSGP